MNEFCDKFIRVVKPLFSIKQVHILDAEMFSEPFKIGRGVHQEKQVFKVAVYADDITIGISSYEDWYMFTELSR
ncbi:24099_t:CDS:2, partial [Gigaspora rosea]